MRSERLLLVVCCWSALAGCNAAMSPEGRKFLEAGNSAYLRGDDKQAIESTSRCLQLHAGIEESGEAYYLRGLARCRSGDRSGGKADLAAALDVTRRKDLMALAHAKMGHLAYESGDMTEAEVHYAAALARPGPQAPPADDVMYRLGCLLQRQGRWREADRQFDKLMYSYGNGELAKLAKDRVRAHRWSIQAAALGNQAAAGDLLKKLGQAGLDARIDLELRDGRMMRLVRVGAYSTRAEALTELGPVRKICSDAYPVPAR